MVFTQVLLVGNTTAGVPTSTTIAHNFSGAKVRVKLLGFLWRVVVGSAQPIRIDCDNFQTTTGGGSIVRMNGNDGTTVGVNTYYTNPSGFGLLMPGTAANTFNYQFAAPEYEGILLGNTLTFSVRDANVTPTNDTGNSSTVSNNFGYAILMLDISKIEDA